MMKNLLLSAIAVFAISVQGSAQAENYKAFEWDLLRIGYALPSGGLGSGLAIGSEPRFNVKDNLSVGLRLEFALFAAGDDTGDVDLGAFSSYAAIGDYYFNTTESKRAFAGAGLGLFSGGSVSVNGQNVDADAGSNAGLIGRAGYEMGILRLTGEYNLIFAEGASNYIGIHLGFTLFGGRKG